MFAKAVIFKYNRSTVLNVQNLVFQLPPFHLYIQLLRRIAYFSIIKALTLILNFVGNNYLIAPDFLSCLQALISNPFNSHLSPFIIRTLNRGNLTNNFSKTR